jgi:hypothetical protein
LLHGPLYRLSSIARVLTHNNNAVKSASASPTRPPPHQRGAGARREPHPRPDVGLVVALQVEFEREIMKPVFRLIGFRLWV